MVRISRILLVLGLVWHGDALGVIKPRSSASVSIRQSDASNYRISNHDVAPHPSPKVAWQEYQGQDVEQIRIVFYSEQLASDAPNAESYNYFMGRLQAARDRLAQAIKVQRVGGGLTLARNCETVWAQGDKQGLCSEASVLQSCGTMASIPSPHLGALSIWSSLDGGVSWEESRTAAGPGVDSADFVIYVTAKPESEGCKANLQGWTHSAVCQRDQQDRPVAGFINFCEQEVSNQNIEFDEIFLAKELTHLLGFSWHSFAFWRDEFGSPRSPRCPTAQGCTESDPDGFPPASQQPSSSTIQASAEADQTRYSVVTPGVQSAAKKHFGCETLLGLQLEEAVGAGGATSLWDKLVAATEYMTVSPLMGEIPVISIFTLAALQDSGWYQIAFENAETFSWGVGEGCAAAERSCSSSTLPWCSSSSSNSLSCSYDRKGFGSCASAGDSEHLPSCTTAFSTKICSSTSSSASMPTCDGLDCKGNSFTASSACLDSSVTVSGVDQVGTDPGLGCYETRCTESQSLEIRGPDGTWRLCSEAGQTLNQFVGFSGAITCPSPASLCRSQLETFPPVHPFKPVTLSRLPIRLALSRNTEASRDSGFLSSFVEALAPQLGLQVTDIALEGVCSVSSCKTSDVESCVPLTCESLERNTRAVHKPGMSHKMLSNDFRRALSSDSPEEITLLSMLRLSMDAGTVEMATRLAGQMQNTTMLSELRNDVSGKGYRIDAVASLLETWVIQYGPDIDNGEAETGSDEQKYWSMIMRLGIGFGGGAMFLCCCLSICYWQRKALGVESVMDQASDTISAFTSPIRDGSFMSRGGFSASFRNSGFGSSFRARGGFDGSFLSPKMRSSFKGSSLFGSSFKAKSVSRHSTDPAHPAAFTSPVQPKSPSRLFHSAVKGSKTQKSPQGDSLPLPVGTPTTPLFLHRMKRDGWRTLPEEITPGPNDLDMSLQPHQETHVDVELGTLKGDWPFEAMMESPVRRRVSLSEGLPAVPGLSIRKAPLLMVKRTKDPEVSKELSADHFQRTSSRDSDIVRVSSNDGSERKHRPSGSKAPVESTPSAPHRTAGAQRGSQARDRIGFRVTQPSPSQELDSRNDAGESRGDSERSSNWWHEDARQRSSVKQTPKSRVKDWLIQSAMSPNRPSQAHAGLNSNAGNIKLSSDLSMTSFESDEFEEEQDEALVASREYLSSLRHLAVIATKYGEGSKLEKAKSEVSKARRSCEKAWKKRMKELKGADAEGLEAFYQLREEIMHQAAKLQRKVGGLESKQPKGKPPPLTHVPEFGRATSKPGESAVAVRGEMAVHTFDISRVASFRRTTSEPQLQ